MAYLNQLLSEQDLASLTIDERDFLVRRIDHVLDTNPRVLEEVAQGLRGSLGILRKEKVQLNIR